MAQFPQHYQIFGLQVQLELNANLKCILFLVVGSGAGYLGVSGGGGGLGWGSAKCEALDVLPLHRLLLEGRLSHLEGLRRALWWCR
jgi:hypothetical protein